jgi:hypothetical protein
MRDTRFIAAHRGGPLSKAHHILLITWAMDCAEHVFPLLEDTLQEGQTPDPRLQGAIQTARAWAKGEVPVGAAQKASLAAHAAARATEHPVAVAVARAVGQAVGTAHMADHSLGGALYALKAVQAAWQTEHLPLEVKELVLSALTADRFSSWV